MPEAAFLLIPLLLVVFIIYVGAKGLPDELERGDLRDFLEAYDFLDGPLAVYDGLASLGGRASILALSRPDCADLSLLALLLESADARACILSAFAFREAFTTAASFCGYI